MQKVILNFIPRPTRKGNEVGLLIEKCLLDWGMERIFTITVDNASSNDTTVAYLRRKFVNWGTVVLGGKFMHMRCVAHIVNLIVKECLKELNESVEHVRTIVRYVRQSLDKLKKFNDFVGEEKIESKRSLCLDVPAKWDSINTMLETAMFFQGVFERCEVSDADFRSDFMPSGPYGKIGLPTKYDWVVVERFVKVLQYFYKLIDQISGSLHVTSNTFLDEISEVDYILKEWLGSDDDIFVNMARQIKVKFDKYWGDVEKMNMILYVPIMLDPRLKFSYVDYVLKNMYGLEHGQQMENLAKSALYDVFEEYRKLYSSTTSHSSCTTPSESGHHDLTERMVIRARRKKKYQQMIYEIRGMDQSELDIYLHEEFVNDSPTFDIIDWWKSHSPKFSILSRLTRDLLAMHISTMATESAFSIGGCIIDNFLASLPPKMTQALICCQDWIRHTPIKPIKGII
ncbi:UNVERIFIED_CONTAM: putative AC transposase [Sesamum radiatum]|uniref:AC transposase n=1 Tax=Sesamum radiatum TaxID=300843 RepID=A0AAW2TGW4_SESRA